MIVSFDLEAFATKTTDISPQISLGGIAYYSDVSKLNQLVYKQMVGNEISPVIELFHGEEGSPMLPLEVGKLVDLLLQLKDRGHRIVTWGGSAFDFRLLAYESGRFDDCVELALNHVDLMLIVVAYKGHWLDVDKAFDGADIDTIPVYARLNGSRVVVGKSNIPELWQHSPDDVRLYVRATLTKRLILAHHALLSGRIGWVSNSGRWNKVDVPELYTVKQCLDMPKRDFGWIRSPKTVESLVGWALNVK